jgi:putative CocE/NonD family hydrolase
MKTPKWLLLLGVSLLVACGSGDPVPDPDVVGLDQFRTAAAGHRSVDVFVPGADGTRLATYVYLPAKGSGPFPTLVMRTPYDLPITPVSGFPEDHANADLEARAEDVGWTEATDRGYALVVQVVRGRYLSGGVFSLFLDEVDDGDALLRWVEKQPWSNGRIGIFGDSASGVVSLQAAASGRPSVQAVYAQATSPDFLGGVIFAGGRIKSEALLPFVLSQSSGNSADHDARLGLTAARIAELNDEAGAALGDMFGAVEAGDPAASIWWTRPLTADLPVVSELQPRWGELLAAGRSPAALDALDVTDRIRAPVLHVSLWHDFFQASAFNAFARLQAAGGDQKLIVLDGTHYDVDDPALWPSRPMFSWFDHHLKDQANGVPGWPPVQYSVSGQAALGMRRAAAWPPAGSTPTVVELAPPSRALVADPARPAPTLGGSHLTVSAGMLDQRPLLARADVIELRGTVLSAATLMAGAASAQIDVLEAGAGDIVVKLVDRRPDGEVRLLRESVVALSGPGTQRVDFAPLAYAFDAGSAPGLVLAGASLPAFVSQTQAEAGTVRVGGARLVLPRLDE